MSERERDDPNSRCTVDDAHEVRVVEAPLVVDKIGKGVGILLDADDHFAHLIQLNMTKVVRKNQSKKERKKERKSPVSCVLRSGTRWPARQTRSAARDT